MCINLCIQHKIVKTRRNLGTWIESEINLTMSSTFSYILTPLALVAIYAVQCAL